MRLERIEDLLPSIGGGTLTREAGVRLLTQTASSRRFRTTEDGTLAGLSDGPLPRKLTVAAIRVNRMEGQVWSSLTRTDVLRLLSSGPASKQPSAAAAARRLDFLRAFPNRVASPGRE